MVIDTDTGIQTAASDGSDVADESDESDDSDNPHDASTTNQAAPASDDSAESDIPDHAPTTTHAEIADDSEESDYADDTPTNTAQTNIPSTTTALTNIAPTNNNNLAPIPLNIQRMADTIKACRRHPGTNGLWQRVGIRKALPNEFVSAPYKALRISRTLLTYTLLFMQNKNHNNLRQSSALYNYVGDTRLFTAREWEHITEVDRT